MIHFEHVGVVRLLNLERGRRFFSRIAGGSLTTFQRETRQQY
jgi:hypothetical protein